MREIGARFLDRIEVFALKVFNQRKLKDIAIGRFADDDGRAGKANLLRRPPPTLTGNEFERIAPRTHDQRLNDAVFTD